jgi:hypothetical protein
LLLRLWLLRLRLLLWLLQQWGNQLLHMHDLLCQVPDHTSPRKVQPLPCHLRHTSTGGCNQ